MASQLSDIITALAGMTVTVSASTAYNGDKTPQALYLSTLPNHAPDAKLPARLIRMMRDTDLGAQAYQIVFGNESLVRVTWRVYDVLLWRTLSQGAGIGSHEADLVKYCAAYVEALKALPAPTTRVRVLNLTMTVGEINFPEGSDYWYAGVTAAVDVEERLTAGSASAWA